ncbi:hypothetical protein AS189_08160 [Arthrobacter alpinus]|uniref:Uncharacterized protein n=1 Tax=Arthrobacter alpinus TaxID=656366 RepID=A0A0S2LYX7_9MICC|nr:hypothetical protein AS189_08160 [Arthrobacter alpinus]
MFDAGPSYRGGRRLPLALVFFRRDPEQPGHLRNLGQYSIRCRHNRFKPLNKDFHGVAGGFSFGPRKDLLHAGRVVDSILVNKPGMECLEGRFSQTDAVRCR